MTQDEIIRMAREAGLGEYLYLDGWRFTPDGDDMKSLERFAALVAAHEREVCAKVGDEHPTWTGRMCAAAIRSRSNEH